MLHTLVKAIGLACFMLGLVVAVPVSRAEQPWQVAADGLTQARIWPQSFAMRAGVEPTRSVHGTGHSTPGIADRASDRCEQPDDATLKAILPVATDHGSHATGVVYDTNRVLTAAHAIHGGSHFFVRVGDVFRSADLVMVDHVNDLAVLAVDTQSIEPLRMSGFNPARSQPVWAVGYPRAQAMMTSTGVLQGSREGALHASASIDSGQSGGGLLSCQDGAWKMLGMLRGYGATLQGDHYVKLPNHSVSVAAATIDEFLRSYH
ncbi:MAG: trypsin-like peptidase domain-containing protein [Granulosicoccus sp.]|nr:trypsin-like peptidase domain-containing protein [Granulosicoccus sp.]